MRVVVELGAVSLVLPLMIFVVVFLEAGDGEVLTQVIRMTAYTHIFHSWANICLVSFQNAPALMDFLPAFLASRNCFDSGKKMRITPTPIEMPAK